ncbi:MAG: hypothetical protein AAF356_10065 [Planctomycetota bacterium]
MRFAFAAILTLCIAIGQTPLWRSCACSASPTANAFAGHVAPPRAQADCCSLPGTPERQTEDPAGERDHERLPCQDDDCQHLCCAVSKVVARAEQPQNPRLPPLQASTTTGEPTSAPASPHLHNLKRPPKRSTAV